MVVGHGIPGEKRPIFVLTVASQDFNLAMEEG
jgi:hypothetical protein